MLNKKTNIISSDNEISVENHDITFDELIIEDDKNENRTAAFVTNKKKHKQDSIGWLAGSLVMFFFLTFSIGRFTIIGQFIDDTIFNFLFGWFKYPVYLLLFFVNCCIFSGIRFKFKKRFLFMVVLVYLWITVFTSMIFMLVAWGQKINFWAETPVIHNAWRSNVFEVWIKVYTKEWLSASIYNKANLSSTIDWFINSNGYFNLWAGGGFFGALIAGILAYLSIPCAFVFVVFLGFIIGMWILTGDPIFLLKPKNKRHGKGLRILSLKTKPKVLMKEKTDEVDDELIENDKWDSMNVFGQDELDNADLTIRFPSYDGNEIDGFQSELPVSNAFEVEDDFDNMIQKSEQDKTEIKYISRRLIDHTIPESRMYGEVSVEEARKHFERDVIVGSPFGDKSHVLLQENEEIDSDVSLDFANINLEEKTQINESIEPDITTIGDNTFISDMFGDDYDENKIVEGNIISNHSDHENEFENKAIEPIKKSYILPSIDLLQEIPHDYENERKSKEIAALKALAVDETFLQFGVRAKVVNTIIGPSVTKFEIQAEHKTKVSQITKLENDFKLALATQNVRLEAPIPGKNLIGIEMGNPTGEVVTMREMVESIPKDKIDSKLLFVLGTNVLGEPITAELNKMPHLLVAGSIGSGKSVMINVLICSILLRAKPTEVKFVMIDPKKVELSVYSKIPHMLTPVISDMAHAAKALQMIVMEMERRYELFMDMGVKNIDVYNKRVSNLKRLPFLVVIIDELADLMMTSGKKEVEEAIMRITQMARAAGIHLVVATQRPSVDVITGTIKTNIPTRIAFAVTTGIDSRTILDSYGSENLLGKGDMLYMGPGSSALVRAQGAFLSDDEIFDIVNHCSKQWEPDYDNNFSKEGVDAIMSSIKDELYEQAKQLVINNKDATVDFLRRKLNITRHRAENIIDHLVEDGIVGQKNGTQPREIYVKPY